MNTRNGALRTFAIAFIGGLTALAAWRLLPSAWPLLWPVLVSLAVVLLVANVVDIVRYWLAGRKGLDQWPDPHGSPYDEWLSLPEGAGDYYEWLSHKMGDREPWLTWARKDRELRATGGRKNMEGRVGS